MSERPATARRALQRNNTISQKKTVAQEPPRSSRNECQNFSQLPLSLLARSRGGCASRYARCSADAQMLFAIPDAALDVRIVTPVR